jgi:hypothetical protein
VEYFNETEEFRGMRSTSQKSVEDEDGVVSS